jgi:hypothetical protein
MNDDLIEKTEAMIKRHEEGYFDWLPIKQIMPELVAEIKRLRAMNPFQVDVPIAIRISGNLFAYGNAEESAELQRLLMQLATKDALNNDLMANCNQLRDRCWKAESKLARWQKIAIEERAKRIEAYCKYDGVGLKCDISSKGGWCDTCTQPSKIRARAAKELNLQATHEAGYVERLEIAFVEEITQALELMGADNPRQIAQDALDKIREDK